MTASTRRVARGALVGGIAFAFVPFIGLSPAHACSCIAADDAQQYKWADVVFKGTLPGKQQTNTGNGAGEITLTFDATRVYKGTAVWNQRVRTANNGAACGLELNGAGPFLVYANHPRDAKGKPVIAKDPAKRVLEANLCGGTHEIGADEDPSFAKGKTSKGRAIERPEAPTGGPSTGDGSGGGGGSGGGNNGGTGDATGAVVGGLLAILAGILGWTSRS